MSQSEYSVKKYMTPFPYTVDLHMSVRVALELMRRHGVRHLPVEEGDLLVGVISDWDILSAPDLDRVMSQSVQKIMSRKPVTLLGDSNVGKAISIMNSEGIGSIIITDLNRRVIGIFTEKDALRVFADAMKAPEAHLIRPIQ